MAKRKNRTKKEDSFRETASKNYEQVKKWNDWKRSINISAVSASTGRFISTGSND